MRYNAVPVCKCAQECFVQMREQYGETICALQCIVCVQMNGFTGHCGCLPDCLCHIKALKGFGPQSGWVPCECLIVTKSHGGESDLSLFSLHELTAQSGSILGIGHNLFTT